MIDNNEIYMVIDENYTATVRDLKAIEAYLAEQTTISKYFGEITYINDDCSREFRNAVKEIRAKHIKRFNQTAKDISSVGDNLEVDRNQGLRDAVIVSVSGDEDLIEYEMPNGTTALNIIKPDGNYRSFSYNSLTNSKKWRNNLDHNLLINNPQSGKAFVL